MLFYHKGLRGCKTPLPFVACARKAAILRGKIWSAHESDVVGVSKAKAKVDLWLKTIAPSTPLRQWFGHDPGKWEEFKKRYEDELNHNSEAVAQLRAHLAQGTVTLVYGAKDQEHNDAVVLQEYLRQRA